MSGPIVSALLPVFNAEAFVEASVRSVLGQSLRDLELIVLDDGSTDQSFSVVERIAAEDGRMRLLRQPNGGIAAARNRLLEEARGRYLATVDADDISEPDRFRFQVDFLDRHAHVGLLGSAITTIDEEGRETGSRSYPQRPEVIRVLGVTDFVFANPTVMMRREAIHKLDGWYRSDRTPADDFDLCSRLLRITSGANLPACLVRYRIHRNQATVMQNPQMMRHHADVAAENLNHACPSLSSSREGFRLYAKSVGRYPVIRGAPEVRELRRTALHVLHFLEQRASSRGVNDPEIESYRSRELRRVERRALGGTILDDQWFPVARCYLRQPGARRARLFRYYVRGVLRRVVSNRHG